MTVIDDLKGEIAHLGGMLAGLDEDQWRTLTAFRDWSVFDHVGHLCISDRAAMRAIEDPETFASDAAEQMRRVQQPVDWKGVSVPALGAKDGAAMLKLWGKAAGRVAEGLARLPDKARVPWFGPSMSVASFATARLMETWAHGETIRDALGLPHPGTTRLRHVCELGWRTRSFALMIHRQPADDAPVYLALTEPGGALWTWGPADAPDRIEGDARDFARVVCQCRNVADTRLKVTGSSATTWMQVAQCFVGGPSAPPPSGARKTSADAQEMSQ